jgi:hypothetical protein
MSVPAIGLNPPNPGKAEIGAKRFREVATLLLEINIANKYSA